MLDDVLGDGFDEGIVADCLDEDRTVVMARRSSDIDLERQLVIKPDGTGLPFEITPFRKYCLLGGFDDIGLTLRHADKIRAFESARLAKMPWLAPAGAAPN